MSKFNEGSPLKDSYPQSGNTVEGYKEELSYQGQEQNQNHHHDRHQRRQQQPLPVGISPEPPSPPPRPPPAAEIDPSKNLSYEEFIAADQKQQSFSSEYAETGFPKSWPKVSPPPPPSPPAKVAPPPVEPSSPAKVFPPPANKASSPNGRRNVQPPPPPPGSCSCCIIL